MEQLKIGVMGAQRGTTFMLLSKYMKEHTRLVAICENNEDTIKQRIEEGVIDDTVKVCRDFDEFLEAGLDAVVLCNYFHEHSKFAIKALKKGIHVMSDTTAAPSLAECVELCEAVEESGAKYMLGANASHKRCTQFMRNEIKAGKIGNVIYGDAEYLHDVSMYLPGPYEDGDGHWRRMMPGTYYNMHTLGSLMFMTDTVPVKVSATTVGNSEWKRMNRLVDHDGAKLLCEMDNGAKFDSTGVCYYGPVSKWYRVIGEKGVLETARYDETEVLFIDSKTEFLPDSDTPVVGAPVEHYKPHYSKLGLVSEEEFANIPEEQLKAGHQGIDYFLFLNFIRYLRGEYEPFFNVYRAAALSAAAILGWKSVLNGSVEYESPDFSDKEARKAVANDYYSPFRDENDEFYLRRTKNL